MRTRVEVVVLAWNDGDLLDGAVSSALSSIGVDAEVLVLDNGSEPAVVAPRDPRVRLIRNPENRGVASGRAQAIRATTSDFVCLLDSDARLAPNCLARLVVAFADPEVALSAPVFADQPAEAGAGRAPSFARKVARAIGLTNRYAAVPRTRGADQWDVDFAIGACQLIRRGAYDAVGGLDESIFYGPEDVDLCLRLRANGWRVVQVNAACEHPARRRNRRLVTRRGLAHASAVVRHLRRHRGFVSVGVSAERGGR